MKTHTDVRAAANGGAGNGTIPITLHGFSSNQSMATDRTTVGGTQIMPDSIETAIYTKLSLIENELNDIKTLLQTPKRAVSLRGIVKSLVSDEELDNSIKRDKKSLFKGADDVLRG